MSTIKFWNKQSNTNQNGKIGSNSVENGKTPGGRNWLHQPEALTNGHVAYLVKFLGNTPVDQPKGIEVVKEAIRKLQFTQQLKKAENGSNYKTKKVEITVSIDGVAIQEPRTNNILHQFPLHKISYCADEKGAKKFFSFIAKTGSGPSVSNGDLNSSNVPNGTANGTSTDNEGHECFVFISNKLASDITLTIGQAFDLAYKRYVNESGKTVEASKLQTQNRQLENTVTAYRQRLRDLSEIVSKNDLERLLVRFGLRDILEVPLENGIGDCAGVNGSKTPDLGIDVSTPSNDNELLIETSTKHFAPIVPPRNLQNQLSSTIEALKPSVGTKLEGLLLNSDSDSDFDPRAEEESNGNKITNDLFGFEPPKQSAGQQLFSNNLLTNGFSHSAAPLTSSPTPLLAPPPKAATPRRTNNGLLSVGNTTTSGGQDLFGSTPFGTGFDKPATLQYEQDDSSNGFVNPFNSVANVEKLSGTNIILSTSEQGITSLDFTSLPRLTSSPVIAANPNPPIFAESTINSPEPTPKSSKKFPVDFLTSTGSTEYETTASFSAELPFESLIAPSNFSDIMALHNNTIVSNASAAASTTNPFCATQNFESNKYDVFNSILTSDVPSSYSQVVEPSVQAMSLNPDPFADFAVSAFNEFKRESKTSKILF